MSKQEGLTMRLEWSQKQESRLFCRGANIDKKSGYERLIDHLNMGWDKIG